MRTGRRLSKNCVSILLFLCILVLLRAGIAHPQEKPLNVAVELLPPCVIQADGAYTGFEIELWESILLAFYYLGTYLNVKKNPFKWLPFGN